MKADKAAYRPAARVVLIAALILMVPLVAMQVTDQVSWTLLDFVVAGALLVGTGFLYELAARNAGTVMYRAAVGVAVGAAFLLTWVNLAVGIIGEPDERANVLYLGVPAVGIIGAVIARLEPRGMARALVATALAQALIAVIALILGWGAPGTGPLEIVALNGMFVALFAGAAWLFHLAARAHPPALRTRGSRSDLEAH
jgi:hypothetical protein